MFQSRFEHVALIRPLFRLPGDICNGFVREQWFDLQVRYQSSCVCVCSMCNMVCLFVAFLFSFACPCPSTRKMILVRIWWNQFSRFFSGKWGAPVKYSNHSVLSLKLQKLHIIFTLKCTRTRTRTRTGKNKNKNNHNIPSRHRHVESEMKGK